MVPEVHLILAEDSFEQLKALAEHPIASKYVTSFFFEANKLQVASREGWEQLVLGPEESAQFEEFRMHGDPSLDAIRRTFPIFRRGILKLTSPCHRYSKQQLEHAFGKYSNFIHFQQDSTQVDIQEKEVAEAMKRFPNLKELTMATHWFLRSWTSRRMKRTFEPAFTTCYETDDHRKDQSESLGIQQMRSLLLGAYHAGLKVETLHCGLVSWRVLQQDTETLAHMRESLSNVKSLRLEFTNGVKSYDSLETEIRIEKCSSWLRQGRLRYFVTAAPNLEHLQISFPISVTNDWPCRLEDIVGEHHWPSLKTVKFQMIKTSEDELVSFCSRHSRSLKSLHLTDIGIRNGTWFSSFTRMRKVLTLDKIAVAGSLWCQTDCWCFQSEDWQPHSELQDAIEEYFLESSSTDEMSMREYIDFRLGPVSFW